MANSLSFNLNGPGKSLPTNQTVPNIYNKLTGNNPVNTALNTAKTSSSWNTGSTWKPTTPTTPSVMNPVQGAYGSEQQRTAGLLGGADPTVKSRTEVTPDGKTIKEDYFPEPPKPQSNAVSGSIEVPPKDTTPPVKEIVPPPKETPKPTTYGSAVEDLGTAAKDTGYTEAQSNLAKQIGMDIEAQANLKNTPIPLTFQQGRGQVLQQAQAQKEAALQGLLSNTLTGRGQTLSALGTRAGLLAPKSAGTGGYVQLDPRTGQPLEGGSIESAIKMGTGFDALAQGSMASAIDTQAINGAESGIQSITDLIQKGNLNPSNINLANETIQAIQGNLSSQDYMTLLNSLEAINAALTKVTGTPVDIAKLSSSQGTSLIGTINNQVQIAKAIAAGKAKSQTQSSADPLGLGI